MPWTPWLSVIFSASNVASTAHSSCVFQMMIGSRRAPQGGQGDLAGRVGQADHHQDVDARRFVVGDDRVDVFTAVGGPREANRGQRRRAGSTVSRSHRSRPSRKPGASCSYSSNVSARSPTRGFAGWGVMRRYSC